MVSSIDLVLTACKFVVYPAVKNNGAEVLLLITRNPQKTKGLSWGHLNEQNFKWIEP